MPLVNNIISGASPDHFFYFIFYYYCATPLCREAIMHMILINYLIISNCNNDQTGNRYDWLYSVCMESLFKLVRVLGIDLFRKIVP